MIDYQFYNGAAAATQIDVIFRTDANPTDLRFTIQEIKQRDNNTEDLLLQQTYKVGDVVTEANLIAFAIANSLNLVKQVQGGSVALTFPNQIQLATPGAPATVGGAGQVQFNWAAVTNAKRYVVDRATNVGFSTGVTLGIYDGPLLTFTNTGLAPGTYYFRVRAITPNYLDSATTAATSGVAS